MRLLENDNRTDRHMVQLLHTIHVEVIEALLMGTIGHKWTQSQEFRKHFLEVDECQGVYVLTFVVDGHNGGLTSGEWKSVRDMVKRYRKKKSRTLDID